MTNLLATPCPAEQSSCFAVLVLLPLTPPPPSADTTVAPIVIKFLNGLQEVKSPDGTSTYQNGAEPPTPESLNEAIDSLLSKRVTVPGVATQPGFLDTRAVGSGCSEGMGIMRVRSSSSGSANIASSTRNTGSRTSTTGGSSGTRTSGTPPPVTSTPLAAANRTVEALPVNCTAGTVFNGTACVPCPAGTVLDGASCVCANGTAWSVAQSACVATAPAPTTTPCSANSTSSANGTGCGTAVPAAPAVNGTVPAVQNSTGVVNAVNGTVLPADNVIGNATVAPTELVNQNGSIVAGGDLVPVSGARFGMPTFYPA